MPRTRELSDRRPEDVAPGFIKGITKGLRVTNYLVPVGHGVYMTHKHCNDELAVFISDVKFISSSCEM